MHMKRVHVDQSTKIQRVSYADVISQGKSMVQLINACYINSYISNAVDAIYYVV